MQRERRGGLVVRWMSDQPLATLYVTSLSYAEILFGIHLQPEGKRRRHFAEQAATTFAEDFAGRVLSFDLAAAPAYAAIATQSRRASQALSAVDRMIAAIARTHGAAVATRDRVPLVNPWEAL
jgi:toxin FitB